MEIEEASEIKQRITQTTLPIELRLTQTGEQCISILSQNDGGEILADSKEESALKEVDYSVVPIFKHLRTASVYILAGDILVDLDFGSKASSYVTESEQFCSFSAMNWFKNLTSVEIVKDNECNEMGLTNSQDSLFSFPKIIEILENYPDSFTHEFGQLLRHYQHFVSGQEQKAKHLANDANFQLLIPQFEAAYIKFLSEARKYVKKNLTKNRFQFYMIVRSNLRTFTPDINRIGLSSALSRLLGGSSEQLTWFLLHCGLFEFFSKDTRNQFYFSYLSRLLNRQSDHISNTINLVTLDGIELQVKYEMQTYFGENAEPNVIFFYPYQLILISFDIPAYMEKKVDQIRQPYCKSNVTPFQLKEMDGDVAYQVESQVFLETHYADRVKNVQGNTLLPKEKRKYQKHPKSQHQIDFRNQNKEAIPATKESKNTRKKDKANTQLYSSSTEEENLANQNNKNNNYNSHPHIQSEIMNSQANGIDSPIEGTTTASTPNGAQLLTNQQDYAMLNVASFNQNNPHGGMLSNQNQQKVFLGENISVNQQSHYAYNFGEAFNETQNLYQHTQHPCEQEHIYQQSEGLVSQQQQQSQLLQEIVAQQQYGEDQNLHEFVLPAGAQQLLLSQLPQGQQFFQQAVAADRNNEFLIQSNHFNIDPNQESSLNFNWGS